MRTCVLSVTPLGFGNPGYIFGCFLSMASFMRGREIFVAVVASEGVGHDMLDLPPLSRAVDPPTADVTCAAMGLEYPGAAG